MRPVILSRPAKTPVVFGTLLPGGSIAASSLDGRPASAGCWGCGCGCCCCCGAPRAGRCDGVIETPGAVTPPGGGGKGCDWILPCCGAGRLGGPGGCKVRGASS